MFDTILSVLVSLKDAKGVLVTVHCWRYVCPAFHYAADRSRKYARACAKSLTPGCDCHTQWTRDGADSRAFPSLIAEERNGNGNTWRGENGVARETRKRESTAPRRVFAVSGMLVLNGNGCFSWPRGQFINFLPRETGGTE